MKFNKLIKVIMFALAFIFILLGLYKIVLSNNVDATLSLTAGFILIFLTNIEHIESLKGLGLEAKLRQRINEADALITQLQNISLPLSEMLFTVMVRSGRHGRMTRTEEHMYVERVASQLKSLGIDDETIEVSKKGVYYFYALDMASVIRKKIDWFLFQKQSKLEHRARRIANGELDTPGEENLTGCDYEEANKKALKSINSKVALSHLFDEKDYTSFGKALYEFIESMDFCSEEERRDLFNDSKEEFEDLKFFIETKRIRRPKIWFSD